MFFWVPMEGSSAAEYIPEARLKGLAVCLYIIISLISQWVRNNLLLDGASNRNDLNRLNEEVTFILKREIMLGPSPLHTHIYRDIYAEK